MKNLLLALTLFFIPLSLQAQLMDANTLYNVFGQQKDILLSSSPDSPEYTQTKDTMLKLYPQLLYHATKYINDDKDNNALAFAQAYVDMPNMPEFKNEHFENKEAYAQMVSFVAERYFYNKQDYVKACYYFDIYLQTGEQKLRYKTFLLLALAHDSLGNTSAMFETLDSAFVDYPTDHNLFALSINKRMEHDMYAEALPYVEKALFWNPDDNDLLSIKGQCLERMGSYADAAAVFARLAKKSNTLTIYKHYAFNLFNSAVALHRDSASQKSIDILWKAIDILESVIYNDSTSVLYTRCLALAYLYTDQPDELAQINSLLHNMGVPEVQSGSSQLDFALPDDDTMKPVATVSYFNQDQSSKKAGDKLFLDCKDYIKHYVKSGIEEWQHWDKFEETSDEYEKRVNNDENIDKKKKELFDEAKHLYCKKIGEGIKRSDFSLGEDPYDADNETFYIKSTHYGDVVLKVPRVDNQARQFNNDWSSVTIKNPVLDICQDGIFIRSIDFVTPQGIVYPYSNADGTMFSEYDVEIQFDDNFDYDAHIDNSTGNRSKVSREKKTINVGESDVDVNVPETNSVSENTWVFIIGNENYKYVEPVPFALNDANSVMTYAHKTLGIPENHIRIHQNATSGEIRRCVTGIKNIAKVNTDVNIIFYYTGHGIPNEKGGSAYLLPIDEDGNMYDNCYSLEELYKELGQSGAKSIIVLLDACFSGSIRGDGMIVSARGVVRNAQPAQPQGRMVVMSAASGTETAFPYKQQQHGMFTYFFLKHLQETRGKTKLGELFEALYNNVRKQSVEINQKPQTPTVSHSEEASDWRDWKFKK